MICSRPDSILWQVSAGKVEKSAQFKSKKIGALRFGTLYRLNSLLLSVSNSHLILLNHGQNRILSYELLLEGSGGNAEQPWRLLHDWNAEERTLTLLRRRAADDGQVAVIGETYKAMNLSESLDAHARAFSLK